jgi:hypothetical protein
MIMHALINEAAYIALGPKLILRECGLTGSSNLKRRRDGQKVSIWAEPRSKGSVSADGCLPGLLT